LALNQTCFLQAIAKSGHQVSRVGKRSAAEEPNYRRRWLLRPRDERPCGCRTSNSFYEIASPHCRSLAQDYADDGFE
jgi:hypothetical protein